MRIITNNTCSECCYCIDDYDNEGLCCRDSIYKHIKMNQCACRHFCGDGEKTYDDYLQCFPNILDDIEDLPDDYEIY